MWNYIKSFMRAYASIHGLYLERPAHSRHFANMLDELFGKISQELSYKLSNIASPQDIEALLTSPFLSLGQEFSRDRSRSLSRDEVHESDILSRAKGSIFNYVNSNGSSNELTPNVQAIWPSVLALRLINFMKDKVASSEQKVQTIRDLQAIFINIKTQLNYLSQSYSLNNRDTSQINHLDDQLSFIMRHIGELADQLQSLYQQRQDYQKLHETLHEAYQDLSDLMGATQQILIEGSLKIDIEDLPWGSLINGWGYNEQQVMALNTLPGLLLSSLEVFDETQHLRQLSASETLPTIDCNFLKLLANWYKQQIHALEPQVNQAYRLPSADSLDWGYSEACVEREASRDIDCEQYNIENKHRLQLRGSVHYEIEWSMISSLGSCLNESSRRMSTISGRTIEYPRSEASQNISSYVQYQLLQLLTQACQYTKLGKQLAETIDSINRCSMPNGSSIEEKLSNIAEPSLCASEALTGYAKKLHELNAQFVETLTFFKNKLRRLNPEHSELGLLDKKLGKLNNRLHQINNFVTKLSEQAEQIARRAQGYQASYGSYCRLADLESITHQIENEILLPELRQTSSFASSCQHGQPQAQTFGASLTRSSIWANFDEQAPAETDSRQLRR